jgi:hypothetical protein
MPATAHSTSSINAQSSFAAGEQSFASGGTVSTVGDAAHLESGNAGSHALSFATYRLTLGGVQPGVEQQRVHQRHRPRRADV